MKNNSSSLKEPPWVKLLLIFITLSFLGIIVIVPVIAIFVEAFKHGSNAYLAALTDYETLMAIKLTLTVASIVVPLNVAFGLISSWAISKFEFPGKQLLISLIDLPLSVSPVIAGLIFVLLFNTQTTLGSWLVDHNIQILFATPGIVLATLFVTFPYVARELIPLIQEQGNDEEEAAQLLGAKGLSTYFRVTLPNIKWGVLYGTLLCTARTLGEFGAVAVVSGHIQGLTNTLPLHIEALYNEYNFTAAFAASSILTLLALFTLVIKAWIEFNSKESQHGI